MTFDKNTTANSQEAVFHELFQGHLPENAAHSKLYIQSIALSNLEVQDLLEIVKTNQPSAVFQKRDRSLRNPLHTIIAFDPAALVTIENRRARIDFRNGTVKRMQLSGCPFEFLSAIQSAYFNCFNGVSIPELIEFAVGLIGYVGFGLTSLLEDIEKQAVDPLSVPDSIMMLPQEIIHIDHAKNVFHVISHNSLESAQNIAEQILLLSTLKTTRQSFKTSDLRSPEELLKQADLKASMPKAEFVSKVQEAKQFIEEGQCFQIVLSQRFSGPAKASAVDMFSVVLDNVPSTYNYLLNFPDFQYIGASPETMVSTRKEQVRLCALAGTRPRGITKAQDAKNEIDLQNNEKELAEHLMLVDLGRNDLGKVCVPGSIQVGPIAQVLKYSNVMHLGTEIYGRLESIQTPFSALKACFPRGTVSGAPKVRALELLSRLEPEQRGIYSGAVGIFDARGYMDTAIAIRSALVKDGMVHVNAGAGIVYDSEPEFEYMETINKASAIASVIHKSSTLSADESDSSSKPESSLRIESGNGLELNSDVASVGQIRAGARK